MYLLTITYFANEDGPNFGGPVRSKSFRDLITAGAWLNQNPRFSVNNTIISQEELGEEDN